MPKHKRQQTHQLGLRNTWQLLLSWSLVVLLLLLLTLQLFVLTLQMLLVFLLVLRPAAHCQRLLPLPARTSSCSGHMVHLHPIDAVRLLLLLGRRRRGSGKLLGR